MSWVYISLGSNIEREANTRAGVAALQAEFGDCLLSSVYESEAVGFEGDVFYNMVVVFQTEQDVQQVADKLHQIENEHGRNRNSPKFSSRTLDLDLLLYDDQIINKNGLQIPRDEILKYAFVLWPLAEVAPDLLHPQEGAAYADLWRAFDRSKENLKPVVFDF